MKLNKILSIFTSAVVAFATPIAFCGERQDQGDLIAIATVDENTTYDSWQEGYYAVLNDFMSSNSNYASKNEHGENMCSTYAIRDLNGDGVPELFINYQPITASGSILYTFYDSKVVELRTFPKAGFISYCEDDGIIESSGGGGAGGWGYTTYSRIIDGTIEDIDSFVVSWGTTPNTYSRNGVEISESEYEKYISQYHDKNWQNVGRENYFDDLYCKVGDIYYDYYFTYYEAYSTASYDLTTLTIPNTVNDLPVTKIGKYLLSGTNVKTLNLPANILYFYYYGLSGDALAAINVDSENPYYTSKDGVMYNKDMTELVKYPTARDASDYTFPQSVTELGRFAFAWCTGTKSMVIPETIDTIYDSAFYECPNLSSITIMNPECDIYDYWDEEKGYTICNSYNNATDKGNYLGVIRGYDDSTAQDYADYFGRTFISLGAAPALTTTTTSTTTTSTTTSTTSTTPAVTTTPAEPPVYSYTLGDVNGDGAIDASDASLVLTEYAILSTGKMGDFSKNESINADLNKDGAIDAEDASLILSYYAYLQTGGTSFLEQWLNS